MSTENKPAEAEIKQFLRSYGEALRVSRNYADTEIIEHAAVFAWAAQPEPTEHHIFCNARTGTPRGSDGCSCHTIEKSPPEPQAEPKQSVEAYNDAVDADYDRMIDAAEPKKYWLELGNDERSEAGDVVSASKYKRFRRVAAPQDSRPVWNGFGRDARFFVWAFDPYDVIVFDPERQTCLDRQGNIVTLEYATSREMGNEWTELFQSRPQDSEVPLRAREFLEAAAHICDGRLPRFAEAIREYLATAASEPDWKELAILNGKIKEQGLTINTLRGEVERMETVVEKAEARIKELEAALNQAIGQRDEAQRTRDNAIEAAKLELASEARATTDADTLWKAKEWTRKLRNDYPPLTYHEGMDAIEAGINCQQQATQDYEVVCHKCCKKYMRSNADVANYCPECRSQQPPTEQAGAGDAGNIETRTNGPSTTAPAAPLDEEPRKDTAPQREPWLGPGPDPRELAMKRIEEKVKQLEKMKMEQAGAVEVGPNDSLISPTCQSRGIGTTAPAAPKLVMTREQIKASRHYVDTPSELLAEALQDTIRQLFQLADRVEKGQAVK